VFSLFPGKHNKKNEVKKHKESKEVRK
jgi:hypothetical protein